MASFFWHDYETSGTDPAVDRILQFAGVRTDLDLNVIGEPVNLFCYPGNDLIPDPGAIRTTGIRISDLVRTGIRETDFVGQISREFSVPGTCVAGFNSLRFDDEFSRYAFYRNFIDPYAREWQNGNSRWDVIDLFRMARALRPEGVVWPDDEAGVPTFRLEALTAANDIAHGDAHEAVADVLATVAMAARVRQAQPRLFDFLFQLRDKRELVRQLYPLRKSAVLHVSAMYTARENSLAAVLPLCTHPTNRNGIICYDLKHDPDELLGIGPEQLRRRVFSKTEELKAQQLERVHLKTIHINRCPAVAPLSTLRGDDASRLGMDLDEIGRRRLALVQASGVVETIQEAFADHQFKESDDPDLMLYQGGFFSDRDRLAMDEIRQQEPSSLAGFGDFEDERLAEMLFRYRARNYPDSLDEAEIIRWNDYRRSVALGGGRLSSVLNQLEHLPAEDPGEALLDLQGYLRALQAEL
jgi:exodeoxyribonuclease-1